MKKVKLTIGIAALAIFAMMSCNKQAKVTPASAASGGMAVTANSSDMGSGIGKGEHHNKDVQPNFDFVDNGPDPDNPQWHLVSCPPDGHSCWKEVVVKGIINTNTANNILTTVKRGNITDIQDTFSAESTFLVDSMKMQSTDVEAVINGNDTARYGEGNTTSDDYIILHDDTVVAAYPYAIN